MATFWKAETRSIIPGDWGDYGRILQHGMGCHLPRQNGRLALERTGPYIPPITKPWEIVLNKEVSGSLLSSGLTGHSLVPVEKARIVELHWEMWDLDAGEPEEYPETGEPEDYILQRPHSTDAAEAIGELFEIAAPTTLTILRPSRIVKSFKDLIIDSSTWNGADVVRSKEYGGLLYSERARDWFSENWGEYLMFEQFPSM